LESGDLELIGGNSPFVLSCMEPFKVRGKSLRKGQSYFFSEEELPSPTIPTPAPITPAFRGVGKKLKSFLSQNRHTRQWCVYEFFYSNLDLAYLNNNEFQECLNEMGLGKASSRTSSASQHP
jgi:hypothetical protein